MSLLALLVAFPGYASAQFRHHHRQQQQQQNNNQQAADPGVQGGTARAGGALASINMGDGSMQFFQNGLTRFSATDSVSNSATGNNGLGPRFNWVSCGGCHAEPTVGGSPPNTTPNNPNHLTNPQATANKTGVAPKDNIPSFLTANGPMREVRFPFFFQNGKPNLNAPNGGVETIFTVSGRPDAGGCSLTQPPFAQAVQTNNAIFRIATPTYGAGLVENLDESTLIANQAASANNNFGISGALNHNGNDGTITRFGWKAQNKSLEIFAGEAYNVEQGVSNELFTQDRPLPEEEGMSGLPSNCLNLSGNGYPEDLTNFSALSSTDPFSSNASIPSDTVAFAMFMRFLAPPTASTTTPGGANSISNGSKLFNSIGCGTCHTPTVGNTQASQFTDSLSNAPVNAFSDFMVHHMGTGLADNVGQGGAGGDQFRSAPLWGLSQRAWLLHDGRTSDLVEAITEHASSGSEANTVEGNYEALSPSQQQDVLNFLRSL